MGSSRGEQKCSTLLKRAVEKWVYLCLGRHIVFGRSFCGRRESRFSGVKRLKDIKTMDRLSERNIFYSIKKPFDFSAVYYSEFPVTEKKEAV